MRKAEYLSKDLVSEAEMLPISSSKADYYKFLGKSINENQIAIGKDAVEHSALLALIELDPNDYASEHTEDDVAFMIGNKVSRRLFRRSNNFSY